MWYEGVSFIPMSLVSFFSVCINRMHHTGSVVATVQHSKRHGKSVRKWCKVYIPLKAFTAAQTKLKMQVHQKSAKISIGKYVV